MFVNNCTIFIFIVVRKIMQNKPDIIYVTERFENTPCGVDSGRVDSGADLTSGQVDLLPVKTELSLGFLNWSPRALFAKKWESQYTNEYGLLQKIGIPAQKNGSSELQIIR